MISFNSYFILISPCFYTKSRWKRNRFASFDSIILILWLICAYKENLRILMRKITFKRNRKNIGQMKPGESQRKWMQLRTTMHRAAQPCCTARKAAQPRLAMLVSMAVCLACVARFRRSFGDSLGHLSYYYFSFQESTFRYILLGFN